LSRRVAPIRVRGVCPPWSAIEADPLTGLVVRSRLALGRVWLLVPVHDNDRFLALLAEGFRGGGTPPDAGDRERAAKLARSLWLALPPHLLLERLDAAAVARFALSDTADAAAVAARTCRGLVAERIGEAWRWLDLTPLGLGGE